MKKLFSTKKKMATLVAIATATAAGSASAELPTEVTAMFTGVVTDVGLIFAAAVGVWVAVRSSGAIMRLGNKFISKAGA